MSHYLVANEFILHSDHEGLKYIQGQHKLSTHHANWVEYLQTFCFTIKHKSAKLNKGADALLRKHLLLSQLGAIVLGFEQLKPLYDHDKDFGELFKEFPKHPKGDFLIYEGFLFKGTRLCVPHCCIRELLIHEVCEGSFASHFGERRLSLCSRSITFGHAWRRMSKM